jgi:hypothetical protein
MRLTGTNPARGCIASSSRTSNMIKCFETGFIIPRTEVIFGVSCPATNGVEPICKDCVDKVPEAVKRKGPGMTCEPGERGIDVYAATAQAGEGEGYDPKTFVTGKFLFSLSQQNARKFLPRTLEKLPKPAKSRAA